MNLRYLDYNKIENIRKTTFEEKCYSQTTEKYQNDVLQLLDSYGTGRPGDVLEIGCYLGGLTAQLAYACSVLNRTLHVIDVNVQYLSGAMYYLNKMGLSQNVVYFHGTLDSYLSRTKFFHPLLLAVIDGDHTYEGVRADINSILKYQSDTENLVFHDFSLRCVEPERQNIRVDRAVIDVFSSSGSILPFGSLASADGELCTTPHSDGHYHEQGFYEGALVQLNKHRLSRIFSLGCLNPHGSQFK